MKKCLRTGVLVTAVLIAAFAAAAPIAAEVRRGSGGAVPGSMGIPQPEPRISISIKQRSLGRVLSEVFKQTPYKYAVRGMVGSQVYDVEVKNMPLRQVLDMVLSQDKSDEPMVYGFNMTLTGEGTFTFDRELMDISVVEGQKTLSVANARITKMLPKIFDLMMVKYRIEPDVPPVLVSLQLRPAKWEEALAIVILEAYKQEPAITYSMDGDTYVVHIHKTPVAGAAVTPGSPGSRKVRLALTRVPLREALNQLFEGSTWKYQVADKLTDVAITLNAQGEPELAVLLQILRQASSSTQQLTYREGKGVLFIEPGPLPGQAGLGGKSSVRNQMTTSLSPNQKPLRDVIRQIEGPLGVKFRIKPDVPNVAVTFSITNGTVEDFLKAIVDSTRRSVPKLSVRSIGENEYAVELGRGM